MRILWQLALERHQDYQKSSPTISRVGLSFGHIYQILELEGNYSFLRKQQQQQKRGIASSSPRSSSGLERQTFQDTSLSCSRNEAKASPGAHQDPSRTNRPQQRWGLMLQPKFLYWLIFLPWTWFPRPDPHGWYFSSPPFFRSESILVCFWSNICPLLTFPSNYQAQSCALDYTKESMHG